MIGCPDFDPLTGLPGTGKAIAINFIASYTLYSTATNFVAIIFKLPVSRVLVAIKIILRYFLTMLYPGCSFSFISDVFK
jgi:hypothetical protein